MVDCIFCKIVKGDIPCYKIFENDKVLAFLDINPINPGHTLVISKKHYETLKDMPPHEWEYLNGIVHDLYQKINKKVEPDGINIVQNNGKIAGQAIPHVHVHIIPRFKGDESHYQVLWKPRKLEEKQMKEMQKRLK